MRIIPTEYRGIKYRSRTEARWAVVFDQLGWRYIYEMEGYDLPCGWYLPDFYLPDLEVFFEVKGFKPSAEERLKATFLSKFTEREVIIAPGPPNPQRNEWDNDLLTFVPERFDDEVVVFDYDGGFVSRRWPQHPTCSINMGNLAHHGSLREVGWKRAFTIAANARFGVFDN